MATGWRTHLKPLLGLVYLAVLVLLGAVCVSAYDKTLPWQHTVEVTLTTQSAGLEMNPLADVKLQGIRVGEVRDITSDGTNAVLHLALDPGQVHLVPSDVDAEIVPKTLFGAKFVNLVLPPRHSSQPIAAGADIRQSTTSVEVGQLFTHLEPILKTLNPAQLSVTLDALAQTLSGRGEELGQNLELVHQYLTGFDPHLETFTHDLHQLAGATDVFNRAAPDFLRLLDNSRAIGSDLLVPHEQSFASFLDQTIATVDETNKVLSANAHDLITLSGNARPIQEVLAAYSSEFPCLITAVNLHNALADRILGGEGPYLRVSIDLVAHRDAYQAPGDLPRNPASDASNTGLPFFVPNWAPHCALVPPQAQGVQDVPPYYAQVHPAPAQPAAPRTDTDPRQAMANSVAAVAMGVSPDQVPGVGSMLVQPLLADGQVS
ncbi:MCE family protein [Amycolatopsis sp. K13G38]|uniref:MCE family protein n=1 Tax=Amycolatopsis acididurans TaxID=2724524 RepID=A0ABX1JG66_9PSEU|nr:MCE family protein [Amycolatopsis acididurans]NKQ57755.1 MCE family protein [Amycolatopsis acididurans]